jgi:hypothetical protein
VQWELECRGASVGGGIGVELGSGAGIAIAILLPTLQQSSLPFSPLAPHLHLTLNIIIPFLGSVLDPANKFGYITRSG